MPTGMPPPCCGDDDAGSGYASVVVDEAQDMGAQAIFADSSPSPLRGSRTICSSQAMATRESTAAIVWSWGRCGIDIRGRSRKLRLNYRTTEETRSWASQLLAGRDIDDLDGGSDDNKGIRSLTRGPEPVLERFDYQGRSDQRSW